MKVKLICKRCSKEFQVFPCFNWIKYCSKKCRYVRQPLDPRIPKNSSYIKNGVRTWEAYQKALKRHRVWYHKTYKKLTKEERYLRTVKLPEHLRNVPWHKRARMTLLEKMGGKCKKCGNSDFRVLQLDHVKGNGNSDRRKASNGRTVFGNYLYRLILKGLEPLEKYQLLCANCNWIKRHENNENGKKDEGIGLNSELT